MAGKRPRTSAEQPVQEPSVAVDPTDSTEQLVAGTTIQCRSDSSNNSSAAQPAKPSAEQPVQVYDEAKARIDCALANAAVEMDLSEMDLCHLEHLLYKEFDIPVDPINNNY